MLCAILLCLKVEPKTLGDLWMNAKDNDAFWRIFVDKLVLKDPESFHVIRSSSCHLYDLHNCWEIGMVTYFL